MQDVVVLMSTYNGQSYLPGQIGSIFSQDYEGTIDLLIRDDGSSDDTVSIIRNYPQTESRKIKLIEGKNLGPQRSFLELIRTADEAKFYFFADQDDIWYEDKIKRGVKALESFNSPACYCCNYDIYNSDLDQKKEQIIESRPEFTPLKTLFYNQIPGCTMGFNNELMKILKNIHLDNVMMHDSMVLSLAASVGDIIFDPKSGISHVIHGNNVVGEGHKKIIPHKWVADKFRLLTKKDDYDVSKMADEFIKQGNIKEEYLPDLILLRDFKNSRRNTHKLLRHKDTHDKAFDRTTMSIRSKIFFHVF